MPVGPSSFATTIPGPERDPLDEAHCLKTNVVYWIAKETVVGLDLVSKYFYTRVSRNDVDHQKIKAIN